MIIHVYAHSRDCNDIRIEDMNGNRVFEHDGYIPLGSSLGGGDDVDISIDNETGKIIGWKPITQELIDEWKNENDRT